MLATHLPKFTLFTPCAAVGTCLLTVLLLLLPCSGLHAQTLPAYSNAFLELGVEARAEALGRTTIVAPYSPGQARVNPSLLSTMALRHNLLGCFALQFSGMANLEYLEYGYRVDTVSGIALGLLRFSVPGIQNTLAWRDAEGQEDYTRITRFTASDYALLLSYGRQLPVPGLALGGTAKLIYRHVGAFAQAFGVGVDLTLSYRRKELLLAMALRDATSTFTGWFMDHDKLRIETPDSVFNESVARDLELRLPSLELAAGYQFSAGQHHRFWLGLDLDLTFDGRSQVLLHARHLALDPRIGFEWSYRNIVHIRAGARQWQWYVDYDGSRVLSATPSLGVGFTAWNCTLDYAIAAPALVGSYRLSHMVSFAYQFGRPFNDNFH